MCKALAEIMKPEIDEAFQNGFDDGFDNGFDNGIISIFKNMVKKGLSIETAQEYTEISNELVERALAEMNM